MNVQTYGEAFGAFTQYIDDNWLSWILMENYTKLCIIVSFGSSLGVTQIQKVISLPQILTQKGYLQGLPAVHEFPKFVQWLTISKATFLRHFAMFLGKTHHEFPRLHHRSWNFSCDPGWLCYHLLQLQYKTLLTGSQTWQWRTGFTEEFPYYATHL